MKGSQESLTTVVVKSAANWPTIQARDYRSVTGNEMGQRDNAMQNLNVAVAMHGQAAPASSSSHGSRQELLVDWRTPQANEAGARVETLYTKDGQPARPGERAYRKTPDGRMVLQSQTINQQVEMVQDWATPTARDHKSGRGNNEREYKELTPMVERTQKGKLNPRWVETLMGLPIGWTMPSCSQPVTIELTNSDFLETELCQQQQKELFEC
jgi:hypothetical protein